MAWNEIQHMKKIFTIDDPEDWESGYSYDPSKSWESRDSHDPWTWFASADADSYPHFTAWASDFSGSKATDTLLKFHITFDYARAMPIHVYYEVGRVGRTAKYTGVDANRAGSQAQAAKEYVRENRDDFDALAVSFLKGVFA